MNIKQHRECKVLSPTAILGYGFPENSFMQGIEMNPDLIAVDAGSTDPGPYYLGSGKSFTDREGVKRDLLIMMREGCKRKIPIVIGTAGGSGADTHLQWCREIIEELALELGIHAKMGIVHCELEKEVVYNALDKGKISSLDYVPELQKDIVELTTHVVAQIGVEPIIEALKNGCDIVLAGRTYDPACFAALPIWKGFDPGLAIHMGKILECAAIAASPGSGSDCVMGILYDTSFILKTLSAERKFTRESTCAHTLYEKSDPYHLPGPGGILDLEHAEFVEDADGVRVSGSVFKPVIPYTVKLEGARKVGYRTISLGATRDEIMIRQIDSILGEVRKRVADNVPEIYEQGNLHIHVYGKHGVMGASDPMANSSSHELAILIDAVAGSAEDANTLCSLTRSTLLHFGYKDRIATAGNLAFPFSPSDIHAGEVYEFSIYHIMELEEGEELSLFPIEYEML